MFKIKILFFFLVTTTPTISRCNFSCVNQTWSSSANRLAQWLFDESFFDQMNNYHITTMTKMLFTKNGYVNQAVICNSDVSQILTAPYIPLSSTSFTIDMWLYITQLTKTRNLYGVFGICSQMNISNCLHILIRQNKSNYYLYMGFGDRDCIGVTPLTTKEWIHAAFVFDLTTLTQKIYLNGVFENSSIVSSTPNITEGNTTIGSVPLFSRYPDYAPFQVNHFLCNS
jgi:hypothetical protein